MVFVDNSEIKVKRKVMKKNMCMCYMVADTEQELRDMMRKIGIKRDDWIVRPNTPYEHILICLSQRKMAVNSGAIQITHEQYIKKIDGKNRRYDKLIQDRRRMIRYY